MMTALLVLAVCMPLAAAETTKQEKPQKRSTPTATATKAKQGAFVSTTITTGSLLPSKVRQSGQITDGARNVQVFDSNSIRQSGASDLASFLRRRGATR